VLPPLRIAVTSAVRHAGAADFSGYFRLVDFESGEVVPEAFAAPPGAGRLLVSSRPVESAVR